MAYMQASSAVPLHGPSCFIHAILEWYLACSIHAFKPDYDRKQYLLNLVISNSYVQKS